MVDTGFGIKSIKDAKMQVTVIANEDKDLAAKSDAQAKGFEQSVKYFGTSFGDGSSLPPLLWRTVKTSEVKNGGTGPIGKWTYHGVRRAERYVIFGS